MVLRLRILVLFLLAGPLVARGQDLRTAVPTSDGRFLAAGEYLAWLDEKGDIFRKRPLDRPLAAMAGVGSRLFAVDVEGGELLELDSDGIVVERFTLPVKGKTVGLAADGGVLWAVTDEGEILHGNPDSGWTVMDFNAQYKGYYPRMAFRAVAVGGGSIMVAGVCPDGSVAAFTSSRGTVWSERTLDYSEHGLQCVFSEDVKALNYDSLQDRFLLMGSGGGQLSLPGCSHCNSMRRYPTDTLYARIQLGNRALLLGSEGYRIVE